jgi:hypothetical protein
MDQATSRYNAILRKIQKSLVGITSLDLAVSASLRARRLPLTHGPRAVCVAEAAGGAIAGARCAWCLLRMRRRGCRR